VVCHNVDGVEIPELCGPYALVRDAVLEAAGPRTAFMHFRASDGRLHDVSRDEW
jgi:hypothetical protein